MRLRTTMLHSWSKQIRKLYDFPYSMIDVWCDLVRKPVPTFRDHTLFPHHPDGEHDDRDGDGLQQHAQAHQLLRRVRRAATHHIGETEQQHEGYCADGDRN